MRSKVRSSSPLYATFEPIDFIEMREEIQKIQPMKGTTSLIAVREVV